MTAPASPSPDGPTPATDDGTGLFGGTRTAVGRAFMSRRFAFILAALAVVSGAATFGLWTGTSTGTGTPDAQKVQMLLIADLVILLLLSAIIAQRIVAMWAQRRRGMAGSALHVRLVVMFSLLAVTPAILVAVFAALFLNFGINAWFNERVRTAVDASQVVADAYLKEHIQNIGTTVLAMANELNRGAATLASSPEAMTQVLTDQTRDKGLADAVVVDGNGQVLARSQFSVLQLKPGEIPVNAFERADMGEVAILSAPGVEQVRAIVKLDRYIGAYLLVERFVDVRVLSNLDRVRDASQSYLSLEQRRGTIQLTFVAIFAVVALLLLMAAVWIGMTIANQLARPISLLIEAAEKVSEGDISQRVPVDETIGEMATLSHAFNDMTARLSEQQQGLIEVNRQLDERRRFTETVLGGVSAGVIGLDNGGRLDLANRSAHQLLSADLSSAQGKHLTDVVPEMAEILAQAMDHPDRVARSEISLTIEGAPRTLIVNATAERLGGDVIGYVVTFDDITELQSAQRKAAWSGVARRIAHEIKNPLTPIQLAAERLKRKYLKQIKDDPDTFVTCTDTIVRQVEDLGRMVDEFSAFARMPQAVLQPENLTDLCRQAVFLEKNRDLAVTLETDLPDGPVTVNSDARQVSRALTNVLKNAVESVEERIAQEKSAGDDGAVGWIRLRLVEQDTPKGPRPVITVEDNGIGLPEAEMGRLTEPYVTTRERGTGLGLAIVKKIMEDHGGDLLLENRPADEHGGGACVALLFPAAEAQGAVALASE